MAFVAAVAPRADPSGLDRPLELCHGRRSTRGMSESASLPAELPRLPRSVVAAIVAAAAAGRSRHRHSRGNYRCRIAMRQSMGQERELDPRMAALKAQQEEMRKRVAKKKAQKKKAAGDGRPAEPPLPWRLASHPSAPGQWYYHNEETGETRWEAPEAEAPEADVAAAWRRVEHASQPGQFYYYNEATGETTWDAPAGFEDVVDEEDKQKEESVAKEESKKEDEVVKDALKEEDEKQKEEKDLKDVLEEEKQKEEEVVKAVVVKPGKNAGAAARLLRGESPIAPVEEEPLPAADMAIAMKPVDEEALKQQSEESEERLKILMDVAAKRRAMLQERRKVMKGLLKKTASGLTKDDLVINKRGKIVSKKKSEQGKKRYANFLAVWVQAVKDARSKLNVKGFAAIGGRTQEGQELYETAKDLYEKTKSSA
eukprot:TRINITY_DN1467_c0_g1_i1.p1 TRINITY_DN1467_c0_g1~~TRINITY_DN1467_c0_g1_i1.p1  ORF type:complete len:427 (-),score=143.72 TRINITY_DN1467_c0_g1_i1:40-1320(-)